jgi:hypothetical protein
VERDYKTDFKTTQFGRSYYQHISNGGISYQLERTDTRRADETSHSLALNINLSNFGVPLAVKVPVFATTAIAFELMARHIRQEARDINFDPSYLRENGINLIEALSTEKSKVEFTRADVLNGNYTLEALMQKHRIAVFPEFNSQMWHAEIYDSDSPTPTRKAMANSPLFAAQAALAQPIPEFGDTLDDCNKSV